MKKYQLKNILTSIIFILFTFISQNSFAQETDILIKKQTPAEIEIEVNDYFANTPIMIAIAKCESNFRQFTDAGNIFRGAGRYVGIFQIDEIIHSNVAKSLGFDITTVEGNIGYASYVYKNQGSSPWKNCAKTYISTPMPVSLNHSSADSILSSGQCSKDLQVSQGLRVSDRDGILNKKNIFIDQVALLQQHINRILAQEYNQAAGPIDGIFGPMTKLGVERLQIVLNKNIDIEKDLVIDGIVGPYTMAAINNSCGNI
jgi:peptidoglycan hydrolase-like protein with peptidoglycan-binding domain